MIKYEKITTNGSIVSDNFLNLVQETANSLEGRIINICFAESKYLGNTATIWYDYPAVKVSEEEKKQLKDLCNELKTFSDLIEEEVSYIRYLCLSHNVETNSFILIEKKDLDDLGLAALDAKSKTCRTQRCWYDHLGILGNSGTLYCYDFENKCLIPLIEDKLSDEYTDHNTEYEFNPESRLLEPKKIVPGVYIQHSTPARSLDEMVILESNYFDRHFEELGLVLLEDTDLFPEIMTIEDCAPKSQTDITGHSKTLYRKWDDVHCKCPYYFSQTEETFVPLYPSEKENYNINADKYSSSEYRYMRPFVEDSLLEKIEFPDLPYKVKKYMAKNKFAYHKHVWIDKHNTLHRGKRKMYYYSMTADTLIDIDVEED